jgi:hypothetical protein
MNMPGFTAGASDYKTGANYWMAATPDDEAGSRSVLPQRFCGSTLRQCVQGYLNHDPTASISCNMFTVFCTDAADWLLLELE